MRAGGGLLGLWAIALLFAFLIPLAFPADETARSSARRWSSSRQPFDFVDLYIPSNPFHSLANNIVPAVVLFSVMLGVALIGVEAQAGAARRARVAGEAVARGPRASSSG